MWLDEKLLVRVPGRLKAQLEAAAKERGVSLSALVRMLVSDEVRRLGLGSYAEAKETEGARDGCRA